MTARARGTHHLVLRDRSLPSLLVPGGLVRRHPFRRYLHLPPSSALRVFVCIGAER